MKRVVSLVHSDKESNFPTTFEESGPIKIAGRVATKKATDRHVSTVLLFHSHINIVGGNPK